MKRKSEFNSLVTVVPMVSWCLLVSLGVKLCCKVKPSENSSSTNKVASKFGKPKKDNKTRLFHGSKLKWISCREKHSFPLFHVEMESLNFENTVPCPFLYTHLWSWWGVWSTNLMKSRWGGLDWLLWRRGGHTLYCSLQWSESRP